MKKVFNIDAFPTGYYMVWFVTTQAAYQVHVTLFDSDRVYFDGHKQSVDIHPPLAQDAAIISGDNLKLAIEIDESRNLDNSLNTFTITDANGRPVGYGYNVFIEDAVDSDYNDVYVMLVAWKSKG